MALRYAPFATVKIMSAMTLFHHGLEQGTPESAAFTSAITKMVERASLIDDPEAFYDYYNDMSLFTHIGLADSISLSEDYGTRPVYGIGEPTDPAFVPNNMSVRVSISRLTTDGNSIADYVLKPSYYYDADLQRSAIDRVRASEMSPLMSDRLFHIFLGITDIEHHGAYKGAGDNSIETVERIQNYEMIEFMPTSFNRRISSDNAVVFTDVEGTGKVMGLKALVSSLAKQVPQVR